MKLFAPQYYKKFKCIADKCRHNCCIDWEIGIDPDTMKKYECSDYSLKDEVLSSIEKSEDGNCFAMKENGRCPFLADNGLCRIISECGEDYLSDICRLHPRYFNYFKNHAEIGLGMVCEEATRLILLEPDPFTAVAISDISCHDAISSEFAFEQRGKIFDILKKDTRLCEKLDEIETLYTVRANIYSFDEWKSIFSELEILDDEWCYMLSGACDCECREAEEKYFERFMAYLVYRHIPRSESEENLRAVVGFILASYETVKNIYYSQNDRSFGRLCDIMRLYSSEIEYCEDNVAALIFEFESVL